MADLMPRSATYKVKAGDCLWNIAKEQYGIPTFWEEIAKSNALHSPYRIFAGMTIRLPVIRDTIAPTALGTSSSPSHIPPRVTPPSTFTQPAPEASKVALRVAFPVFKYELDKLPKVELLILSTGTTVSINLRGELSLKRKGSLDNIELSNKSAEMKYKTESDNAFFRLMKVGDISCSPGSSLELSCMLSITSKVRGKVFATSTFKIVSPSTYRYTYEPRAVEGEFEVYEIGGTFGFEADVTLQPKHPASGVSVPEPSQSFTCKLDLIAKFAIVWGICRRVAAGASRTSPVGMALGMASMVVEYDEALHMIGRGDYEPGKIY